MYNATDRMKLKLYTLASYYINGLPKQIMDFFFVRYFSFKFLIFANFE